MYNSKNETGQDTNILLEWIPWNGPCQKSTHCMGPIFNETKLTHCMNGISFDF